MSGMGLWSKVVDFFTLPESPVPLGIFRIFFGLLCLSSALLLYPDAATWLSSGGVMPESIGLQHFGANRLNIFRWLGSSASAVFVFMTIFIFASLSLAIGWFPRVSAAAVAICLTSIAHRNIYILSSADTLMRVVAWFLVIAPSGAAVSVDRLIRVARGTAQPGVIGDESPLGRRMIQLQLCLLYLATGVAKSKGEMWQSGTAVYLVQQMTEFERFPIPSFLHTALASKVLTWGTLAIESSFPLLVWHRATRKIILGAAFGLHLGLEYAMNIQLFQPAILCILGLFLTEKELRGIARAVHKRVPFFFTRNEPPVRAS